MVDAKKPITKPVTAAAPAKPFVPANITRHSIPPLSPLPGEKPIAETAPAASATEAVAPAKVAKLASPEPQATAAPAPASKPVEKLGPKLRKRDDILKALRAGGKVMKVDGLCRIVNLDGSKNATSKRRILSLESQKLLVTSADGNSFALDVAADKKAQEPKPVPAAKPATEEKK